MEFSATTWFFLNLLTIMLLGFYSMQEMAIVSFNRIRLQYYVSKGVKRAAWIHLFLQNPARLFGTTLIGVNVAMFVGSECARRMYEAAGFDPDFAPLTQVLIVIIFAELAPMFAARRYPEHVALLGAPIMYATTLILTPLLWSINLFVELIDKLLGKKKEDFHVILNQEELQHLLGAQDDESPEGEQVNAVTRNIFRLHDKDAGDVLQPIGQLPLLPANATVAELQQLFTQTGVNFIPLYHRSPTHIVGIAQPREFIRAPATARIRDYALPPWFLTKRSKAMQILNEFRRNNKTVAVVLDEQGRSIGIISLEDLTEEIFGKLTPQKKQTGETPLFIMERAFPADMTVGNFNAQFDVTLDKEEHLTLSELMERELEHPPEIGETIYLDAFELTVKEATLTAAKKIMVSTRF